MARLLCLRITGAIALCSLGFLLVSLDPFLSAAPIDPGFSRQTPPVLVNRFRKGDRLPLYHQGVREMQPQGSVKRQGGVPFACDREFSPVTTPTLSGVFGRCMA